MEVLIVFIPIAITIASCIGFSCQYTRLNNRIVSLEETMSNMVSYINTSTQQYNLSASNHYTMVPRPSAPPASIPPASIPPGYGYRYYPENPDII